MIKQSNRAVFCSLAVLAVWLVPAQYAQSCTTPVYQWAMHRWEPDPWQMTLFVEEGFAEAPLDGILPNLRIEEIRPGSGSEAMQALWDQQNGPEIPWAVMRFPLISPPHGQIWAGPYTREQLNGMIDSPVRRQLAERLLAGDAAVFLFLESGNADKDRAARERLDKALAIMPDEVHRAREAFLSGLSQYELGDTAPDEARFPVIDIRRDDSEEWFTVEMLLRSESDLITYNEPMAFPVFGRGRLLYALVGKGINQDTLREACMYIGSACTCTVKVENPGIDLLLRVDWDNAETPFSEALGGIAQDMTEPVIPEEELPDFPRTRFILTLILALGGVFLLLLLMTAVFLFRARQS